MSKSSNTEGIEARLEKLPFLRPMNLAKHENDSHQRIDATDFEIIQDSDYEKLMHQVEGYWRICEGVCDLGISNRVRERVAHIGLPGCVHFLISSEQCPNQCGCDLTSPPLAPHKTLRPRPTGS